MTRSGSTSSKRRTASSARRRSYSSLPGAATQGRPGGLHPLEHGPAEEARAAGDEDALVGQESGHRATDGYRRATALRHIGVRSGWRLQRHPERPPGCETPPVRLAVTLEQCWHRVPGGTATSVLRTVDALTERDDVEVVGVAARHGHPPEEPVRARRAGLGAAACPGGRSTSPGTACGVPRSSGPPARWTWSGPAPWPCRPGRRPWWSPCTTWPRCTTPSTTPSRARGFYRRAFELARTEADLVCCPSQATLEDCAAHGFDRGRLRHVPWGVDTTAGHRRRRSTRSGPASASRATTSSGRAPSSPARTCPCSSRPSPGSPAPA